MENNEWIELLEYLLRQLNEIGAVDTANEVRQAASTRVIEAPQKISQFDLKLPAAYYREVGTITTRLPTPREAFIQALDALRVRLETLPNIGENLAKALKVEPEDVVWKAESKEYEFLSTTSDLTASKLTLSNDAKHNIHTLLNKLEILVREA